ncbi:hypothetical protein GWI33_017900 [Rhynchophorus ferrugineus]|uniref:Uncharacterized protein n=1 Tax=Rhynchophorus ferrugineus TaxID=354439 RepID=A0A834I171_RHYFE|nr:hypothetical protein GWI33_017900 [Rhynchophorus ferrugineus]
MSVSCGTNKVTSRSSADPLELKLKAQLSALMPKQERDGDRRIPAGPPASPVHMPGTYGSDIIAVSVITVFSFQL